jgi:hypothetical protein
MLSSNDGKHRSSRRRCVPRLELLGERSLPSQVVGLPPPFHVTDERVTFLPPGQAGRETAGGPVIDAGRFVPPANYEQMPNQPPSVVRWDSGAFGLFPAAHQRIVDIKDGTSNTF